jgi:hypothetical protein
MTTSSPVTEYFTNTTNSSVSILTVASNNETIDSENVCVWFPEMGRISTSGMSFKTQFQLHVGPISILNILRIPDDKDVLLKFTLRDSADTGGTLMFRMFELEVSLVKFNLN